MAVKIISGTPDLTKSGFYWDGTSMWVVTRDGMQYTCGYAHDCLDDVETEGDLGVPVPETASAAERVALLDAAARLLAAGK